MRSILFIFSLLFACAAFAADTQPGISRAEFDGVVDRGIALLKDGSALSVEDAVLLVRIANTFAVSQHRKFSRDVATGNESGYQTADTVSLPQGGQMTAIVPITTMTKSEETFGRLLWRRESFDRVVRVLGENIPNRGMGIYFKAHDLHWGGAIGNIRDHDQIIVLEEGQKSEPNQRLQGTPESVPSSSTEPEARRP